MKEWNNPQLFSLGVKNTFDPPKGPNGPHYCHDGHNDGNNLCTGKNNQHSSAGNLDHTYSTCTLHEYCCCYDELPPSTPGPSPTPMS